MRELVKSEQNIFDVSLQLTGSLDNFVQLAYGNGIENIHTIPDGTVMVGGSEEEYLPKLFKQNEIVITTGAMEPYQETQYEADYIFEIDTTPKVVMAPIIPTYLVREGQSLIDIYLQLNGKVDNFISLLHQNGLSYSDPLPTTLTYTPNVNPLSTFLTDNELVINTLDARGEEVAPEGIFDVTFNHTLN